METSQPPLRMRLSPQSDNLKKASATWFGYNVIIRSQTNCSGRFSTLVCYSMSRIDIDVLFLIRTGRRLRLKFSGYACTLLTIPLYAEFSRGGTVYAVNSIERKTKPSIWHIHTLTTNNVTTPPSDTDGTVPSKPGQ